MFGRLSAAQMPFGFVLLQNPTHLGKQRRTNDPKPFGHILMHGGFGDSEHLRGLSYRRTGFGELLSKSQHTLLDIIHIVHLSAPSL